MHKVIWDKEINGVLLKNSVDESEQIVPPRPVFHEELDLLGFNEYWRYPKSDSPLLWSIGRRYFYKGKFVAEARGGNIFEAPKLIINDEGKDLCLEPIPVDLMIERNKKALFVLENEAMDFIDHTYRTYKDKVNYFVVSYSGGKDSQVVLDLVSRVIPPDDYMVIFTDTTMEIPPTYEIVEETKRYYQTLYPSLKFYTVRHEKPAYELWEQFGPPSRIHRWCCTVYKTSPLIRFLKNLNHNGQPKVLVFEGVRADESAGREGYSKIAL